MGYREYIYEVDKDLAEKIRSCKTNREYVAVVTDYLGKKKVEEDDYFPMYNLGTELFEFGKYYENSEEIRKLGKELFTSEELQERYEDYAAVVIGKDGLLSAIKWQENRVTELYKGLNDPDYVDPYNPKITQLQRLQSWVSDYLMWWDKCGAIDLDEDSPFLAKSWLYEHTIFDLLRIYKTFDWEHKCMVFCGW